MSADSPVRCDPVTLEHLDAYEVFDALLQSVQGWQGEPSHGRNQAAHRHLGVLLSALVVVNQGLITSMSAAVTAEHQR